MSADNAEYCRHAKTTAGKLGCEEGIKKLMQRFLIHAAAVVAHLKPDVRSRGQFFFQTAFVKGCLVEHPHSGRKIDHALGIANRLGCIGNQVHDHLLKLAGISHDRRQGVVQPQIEFNGLGYCRRQHGCVFFNQRRQIKFLDNKASLAGISQHHVSQLGSIFSSVDCLVDILAGNRITWKLHQGNIEISEHCMQQVIEVVSNTARQAAKALQLLGMQQLAFKVQTLGFGFFEFGDVARDAQYADQLTISIVHRRFDSVHQGPMAIVGKSQPLLVTVGSAQGHGLAVILTKKVGLLLAYKIVVGSADNFRFTGIEKAFEHPVAMEKYPICVFQPDQVGNGLQQGAQTKLTLRQ